MKKHFNPVTLALLLLVGGLYYMSCCSKNSPGNNIVYLNADSLMSQYEMYAELDEELTKERMAAGKVLEEKQAVLAEKIAAFEEDYRKLTPKEAVRKQEQLQQEQQELIQLNDQLTYQLGYSEQKKLQAIHDSIYNYLEEFKEVNSVDFVLSYTAGGPIWYANESKDVTENVVEALNKKHNN